jgi:CHAT domain-containing protein/Tfp pilus assembly protein PilF
MIAQRRVMKRNIVAVFLLAIVGFCLNEVALAQAEMTGAYTEALRLIGAREYEAALGALKRIIEQSPTFDRAYGKVITVYQQMGQPEAAGSYFEALLAKDPQNPYHHYGLGLFHKQQRRLETAEAHIASCIESAPDFAPAYTELVEIAKGRGRLPEVTELLARAVQVTPANAAAYYGLGYAYQQRAEWDKALERLDKAIQLKPGVWEPYRAEALIYYRSDRYQQALSVLGVILAKVEESGDLERRGRIHGLAGSIYSDLADFKKASEHLTLSLEISREIGDRGAEQAYLAQLGVVYGKLGKHQQALEVYERALKMAREVGDRLSEGRNIGLIGNLHAQLANYPQAIDAHLQAANIAREVGDRPSEAAQLGSVSSVYTALGDYPKALEYIQAASKIAREVNNPWLEVSFLQGLGSVFENLGDKPQALAAYEQSIRVARQIGDRLGEAISLAHMGKVISQSGNHSQALGWYEQALRAAREIGAVTVEAGILNDLGKLHFVLKNYSQAEEDHKKALVVGAETRMPVIIWQAQAGLAAACERQGRPAEAINHYRLAVETIEKVRQGLEIAEEKAGFLQDKIEVYKNLVDLLAESHQREPAKRYAAEAFHYAERERARAFLDSMAEARLNVEQGIATALLDRRREIEARISQLQSRLIKEYSEKSPDRKKVKMWEADLAKTDEDYQTLRREIRRQHPRYADLQYPEPVRLEQAQQLLGEKSLLLEYSLGQTASFLFAVSRDDHLVARLSSASSISDRVKRLREAIARPDRKAFSNYLVQARSLYQELIRPAGKLLSGKQELIIVADGALHYLPFEVLLNPDGALATQADPRRLPYLVRDYAVSYVPSASVLAGLSTPYENRAGAQRMFLAYADPVYDEGATQETSAAGLIVRSFGEGKPWRLERLERSRKEVEGIARLYPGEEVALFLGEQASEENVKAGGRLGQYRLIHFAAHGLLNENKPQFSGLVLRLPRADRESPEDGLLQVYEIFNLKLNADLVVLSACETGLGKEVKGEGLVGLTRAFLYAGTPSVVVSLWKVADISTAELMIRLHRRLKEGTQGKAEALRKAQLELIREGRFAHPYHWAPFVLVGSR